MRKSFFGLLVLAFAVSMVAIPAFAAKGGNKPTGNTGLAVTATLSMTCTNCATDEAPLGGSGDYSLQMDNASGYMDGNGVQSQILSSGAVYTLDTMDTLVGGVPGPGTRTVQIHLFSPVEGLYPDNVIPSCWGGSHDQDQAVNWSVFSSTNTKFTLMQLNTPYDGFARMDFNVRNGACDRQIYRYFLRWYSACIVRTGPNTWEVTSDSCGRATNYGEASLEGQGGRKKETVSYGDWRVPYKLTLTAQ